MNRRSAAAKFRRGRTHEKKASLTRPVWGSLYEAYIESFEMLRRYRVEWSDLPVVEPPTDSDDRTWRLCETHNEYAVERDRILTEIHHRALVNDLGPGSEALPGLRDYAAWHARLTVALNDPAIGFQSNFRATVRNGSGGGRARRLNVRERRSALHSYFRREMSRRPTPLRSDEPRDKFIAYEVIYALSRLPKLHGLDGASRLAIAEAISKSPEANARGNNAKLDEFHIGRALQSHKHGLLENAVYQMNWSEDDLSPVALYINVSNGLSIFQLFCIHWIIKAAKHPDSKFRRLSGAELIRALDDFRPLPVLVDRAAKLNERAVDALHRRLVLEPLAKIRA